VFSALVDLGLNPLKENNSGQTALDIAAAHEKPKILALFARDY
jgi:ankyrin repeat protein